MNNLRLLAGMLCAALLTSGVRAVAEQRVITLEEIFNIAENNSSQLRPAFDVETEADRQLASMRADRLPDINATLSLSFLGDGFTTKRNFSDYQKAPIPHFGNGLTLNVAQPLYTGGAISNSIEMAKLQKSASRFSTDLKRNDLRFELTSYYLDWYKYHTLNSVIKANLKQAQEMLRQMHARYEQGLALQNDITRYELLVANLDLEKIRINNMIDILGHNIKIISGIPDSLQIQPDSTIIDRALPNDSEQWWQTEAKQNSPTLKLARNGVHQSRTTEKLVHSASLPKIGLQASWTIDGPILVEVPPINRNLSYWYVGVGISYDISSVFKNNRAIAKSKSATHTAEDLLAAADERINMSIRGDYIHYLEANEELKSRRISVELANRNYHTTSTRYIADMALITDLLDATNAKLEAEQQLVDARINILYYYFKLLFTTGKI